MMPELRERAAGRGNSRAFSAGIKTELKWVLQFLKPAIPTTLVIGEARPLLQMLTDASLEQNDMVAGLGGVLVNGD